MSQHTNNSEHLKSGLTVVKFWAPWCGPCRAFAPIFDKAAKQLQEANPALQIYHCNVDEESKIATEFNVRAIPTILVVRDGVPIGTIVGNMTDTLFQQKVAAAAPELLLP